MHRLGGSVIGFAEPGISSVAKGETLADTVRMIESYSDVIVLRHKIEGSAKFAAEIAGVPVLNGGDGSQHHPSQTLTDLYTIRKEFGQVDNCNILLMGDLQHTRSASSLAYGLGHFKGITLFLVSPQSLKMRPEVTDYLDRKGVKYVEGEDPSKFMDEIDVVYVTRLQKERFPDPKQAETLKGSYVLTRELLKQAPKKAIVLHHLPRIDEIPPEVDYTPNARYFQQAANGVPVRMAFLHLSVCRSKYRPVKKSEPAPSTSETRRCANCELHFQSTTRTNCSRPPRGHQQRRRSTSMPILWPLHERIGLRARLVNCRFW